MKNNKALFHSLFLTAFSAAIFLPITGKGFIHDDFVHLFHAWSHSFWNGALTPSSGAFFTPVTNMSFKMDWSLWGGTHPFPLALENLLLHLTVVLLLYALVAKIWQSHYAAFWTSFGFSLLFPSDTWAVMWIATRAHILVAVFGLLGMHSVLSLAQSQRHRSGWIFLTLLCAVGAALSKENGVTISFVLPIMLLYFNKFLCRKKMVFSDWLLMGLPFAVLAGYLPVRAMSGAIAISFTANDWYAYSIDWRIIFENLLRYTWRSYGLLFFIAAALYLKRQLQSKAPRFTFVSKYEVLVSIILFVISIAPFLMMRARSGIYSYFAAIFAALLLGAVLHSFEKSAVIERRKNNYWAWIPVLPVLAIYIAFTYGYSERWLTMAETNSSVLRQIQAAQPECKPYSTIVLRYSETDRQHRFPEGLSWGFSYAVRLYYRDPTLDGILVQSSAALPSIDKGSTICFDSTSNAAGIVIAKTACRY